MTRVAHRLSRFAPLGLVAVLLTLAAFSFWASDASRRVAQDFRAAVAISDAYQQARYAAADQAAAQQSYARETLAHDGMPSATSTRALAEFDRSSAELTAALHILWQDGAYHRRLAIAVSAQQRSAAATFRRIVNFVNTGDVGRANDVMDNTLEPMANTMERTVRDAARRESALVVARLEALERVVDTIQTSTIAVFTIGLAILGVFALVLRAYRRRVDEARAAEMARLAHAALTDSLTGLGNHRRYQEEAHRVVAQALQCGEPLTLGLVDIDDFKVINDHNGHMHGDRVLTALAALLHDVGGSECAFRRGGDEFALLLPGIDEAAAVAALERLRAHAQARLLGATVSVGIAALTPADCDVTVLQEWADAALYEAKRRGRDMVVAFDANRDGASVASSAKAHAVRLLLGEGQVTVAFQPIWDLTQGRVLAYEALTRPAATYGFLGPQEAFDVAERIGRAHHLDALCRRAILARAAELPSDTLLFLNVSPQTLDHNGLEGTTLVREVMEAGLEPGRVVLELTERSMARLDVVVREARRLQTLGFRLALDDTGAGNAGLEMLSQVPVDFVKVDRAVVMRALTDNAARAVLAGIVAIARETATYVIAEGIETEKLLAMVRRIGGPGVGDGTGVRGAQGYLLGRPSPQPLASPMLDDVARLVA